MEKRIGALRQFLDEAHSVYHAVAALESALLADGYEKLQEQAQWQLLPGGKYYFVRGGSALMAFRVPEKTPKGFLLSASLFRF